MKNLCVIPTAIMESKAVNYYRTKLIIVITYGMVAFFKISYHYRQENLVS